VKGTLRILALAPFLAPLLALEAPAADATVVRLEGRGIRLEFDETLRSHVVATSGGTEVAVGPFTASESLGTNAGEIADFRFEGQDEQPVSDVIGSGRRHRLNGRAGDLGKTVEITFYDDFPGVAVVQAVYTNRGRGEIRVRSWTNGRTSVAAAPGGAEPAFWSYQSGSYESRPDWVLPLKIGFTQDNFQGMNASDYGGGTPVVDVWRRDLGVAVGHVEPFPRLVSLPVARPEAATATLAVRFATDRALRPGESLATLRTFVEVHRGDHFGTLATYRRLMARQGLRSPAAPKSAFEPIWCAWGYGRTFTTDQVLASLPVVKRLGFGWVTLDDGWQVAEGDWTPIPTKYPRGDADMKAFVDAVHAAGFKAQLWWTPLAADPGSTAERERPDPLLRNADGSGQVITWWDSHYLCPAWEPVRAQARAFVRKAIGEWGFDGLKIDGQHLNAAPPCFNPAHAHAAPEASVEGVPGFFRAVWEAAVGVKPEAVVEICPCGTAYSFFTMPYLNMTVGSDPGSSWQVRLKGKTLKALHGDAVAYFGDHVEMSEGGEDFASTLGVGGVVGTNFAWPGAPGKKNPKLLLTPAREATWAFWVKLYQDKRLSEGEYLGELYDIGFDRPEAHAIRKGNAMNYAFFAKRHRGSVELRGLEAKRYRVRDYETGRELGTVEGPLARLAAAFERHLLLEAIPE
jgi:alpha-galactosidase